MVFDFDGPNRISWAGQNCMLVRVGAAPVSLAAATPATAAVSSAVAAGAVLHLAAGYSDPAGGFRPLAGSRFVVLKESIEKALSRGGFQPAPGVSVLKGWTVACQIKAVACAQGLNGINADSVGSIRTDVEGRAQVSALAAGTYYVFGTAQRGAQAVIWNVRVELRPGTNSVVLDQRNATLVN
jgi:hypothetical protein